MQITDIDLVPENEAIVRPRPAGILTAKGRQKGGIVIKLENNVGFFLVDDPLSDDSHWEQRRLD
jgi:hypothetical protein